MESFLWPLVIFHIIVGVVGLPGNALIILVYGRKRQLMSPHVFILALAVADLMVCLFTPVTVYHWYIRLNYTSDFLCRLVLTVTFVTVYNSCFLTSAIAVDRYQAICRPHRRWMTVRRAKITAVMCLVASLITSLPVYASFDVEPEQGSQSGICTVGGEVPGWVKYFMYSVVLFVTVFSLVVNVVLYGKIYRAIRKQAAVLPRGIPSRIIRPKADSTCTEGPAQDKINPCCPNMPDADDYSSLHQGQGESSTDTRALNHTKISALAATSTQQQKQQQQRPETPPTASHNDYGQETRNYTTDQTMATVPVRQNGDGQAAKDGPSAQNNDSVPGSRFKSKTTKMLLATTVVLFTTWLLGLCLLVVSINAQADTIGSAFLYLFRYIFYLNNAINPFIYGFMNKRFREDCKKTLASLRCRFN
ncbi:D(2) dopamine receptor-like [Patiria miniata]|uniref:G-protein coupled receptors family 1 profile domain-containing protein n=1 Tax=Patiria miniata TaxID=46514 RepID=A0A914B4Y6_PATMI|nr:D(2) dopamine receptor-like [Patiria miniata]